MYYYCQHDLMNLSWFTNLGEPLPAEDGNKDNPENLESLPGLRLGLMQSLHDSRDGKVGRVQHLGRVQQNTPHHTSNTISDKLRRQGDEDTGCLVGVTAIPELLDSQCFGGQG